MLTQLASTLVDEGRGVIALDEEPRTMSGLLRRVGARGSWDSRRAFRELVLNTPDIAGRSSSLVLCEEALPQRLSDGRTTPQAARDSGLLVGVRVDTGAVPTPAATGETVTRGLADLPGRLCRYRALGAEFTRWRAVFRIGDDPHTPTSRVINRNAAVAARHAAIAQASGLVPILEMDVLTDGSHSPDRCAEVTVAIHQALVENLVSQKVSLPAVVLVSGLVLGGVGHRVASRPGQAAADTAAVLRMLPGSLPGVLLSTGRQTTRQAGLDLASVRELCPGLRASFFAGRALTSSALSVWRGDPALCSEAQRTISRRLAEATGIRSDVRASA